MPDGRTPKPQPLWDPRPPTRSLPTHQPGTTVRGHCPLAGAREKRRPGGKGAGQAASAPLRALTRPLLPKCFHALAGDRGSAAVGTRSVPPYFLSQGRGCRGRGCRSAIRPAPQRLLPPPIWLLGRRLPGRRSGRGGGPAVALHGHTKLARSHPQQPLLPPEPTTQRRTPGCLLRGSPAGAEANPRPSAPSVAPMCSKPIPAGFGRPGGLVSNRLPDSRQIDFTSVQ